MPQQTRADIFQGAYERDGPAPGPASADLMAYVEQVKPTGHALDIGAGVGRNSLPLAAAGLHVTAVDLSKTGIAQLQETAARRGLRDRIDARVGDCRELLLESRRYSVIVAATILDHLPPSDATTVLARLIDGLADNGVIYVEVLTTDDPGHTKRGPISECAAAIAHYFAPGELLDWCRPHLRIMRYEERWETDRTHGPDHLHGKAALLGVRPEASPDYHGFPRPVDVEGG